MFLKPAMLGWALKLGLYRQTAQAPKGRRKKLRRVSAVGTAFNLVSDHKPPLVVPEWYDRQPLLAETLLKMHKGLKTKAATCGFWFGEYNGYCSGRKFAKRVSLGGTVESRRLELQRSAL